MRNSFKFLICLSVLSFVQVSNAQDVTVKPDTYVWESVIDETVDLNADQHRSWPVNLGVGEIVRFKVTINPNWVSPPTVGICRPDELAVFLADKQVRTSCQVSAAMYSTDFVNGIKTEEADTYHFVVQNGKFAFSQTEKEIDVRVDKLRPFEQSTFRTLPDQLATLDHDLSSVFTNFEFNWAVEDCRGESNASYTPDIKLITMCTPFLEEHAVNGSIDQSAIPMVLMHEISHGLIDQWGLPGAGNEELADEMGAVLLYLFTGGDEQAIGRAVRHWRDQSGNEALRGESVTRYNSPHPQPLQRGRNLSTFANDPEYYLIRWFPILVANLSDDFLQSIAENNVPNVDSQIAKEVLVARKGNRSYFAQAADNQKHDELGNNESTLSLASRGNEEFVLWLSKIEDEQVVSQIGAQPFLIALIINYQEAIGEPHAFQVAINDDMPICLSACRDSGVLPVEIGVQVSSSDFIKMIMNTNYGHIESHTNRWAALARMDRIIADLGLTSIKLSKEDAGYFANDFAEIVRSSSELSDRSYQNINQLVSKAKAEHDQH